MCACSLLRRCYRSSSGVFADLVETLEARFQHEALDYLEFIQWQGRDLNLLTRAVHYIADAHPVPPMGTDIIWVRSMMDFAVELAVPNSGISEVDVCF
jgi:hypothetical protein